MNKRIKKKRATMTRKKEQKVLKQLMRQLKQLAYGTRLDIRPKPDVDMDMEYLSKFTKELCDKTVPDGFACSDVIMNQSDGVISGTIHIIPTEFPIDIKILKDGKEDTFIE